MVLNTTPIVGSPTGDEDAARIAGSLSSQGTPGSSPQQNVNQNVMSTKK